MGLEEIFEGIGGFIGRRPLVTLSGYLAFATIGLAGWSKARIPGKIINDWIWSYEAGPTHSEMLCRDFLRKTDPWGGVPALTFMIGHEAGAELSYAFPLDEMLEMYKGFINSTGYPWTERYIPFRTYDITQRALGAVPDTHTFDGGFPVFPATHLLVFSCFQQLEETYNTCAYLPEDVSCAMSYATLEPFMYVLFPLSVLLAPAQVARPSYRPLNSDGIRLVLGPGCFWFTKQALWFVWTWGGGTTPILLDVLAGSPILALRAYLFIK